MQVISQSYATKQSHKRDLHGHGKECPFIPPPAQIASVLDKTERGHLDVPRAICKAQFWGSIR